MRKRVWVTLAVCLVAVAGVICWQIVRLRQPVYQGKTLLEWLWLHAGTPALSDEDRAAHQAAVSAVRHIGTNGLPTLLAWAGMKDSPFKKKVLKVMGEEARSKLGVCTAHDYRAAASYAFGMRPGRREVTVIRIRSPQKSPNAAKTQCVVEGVQGRIRRSREPERGG